MAGKRRDIYRHFKLPERELPVLALVESWHRHQTAHLRMIADLVAHMQRGRRRPPGTAAAPIPADPRKPNTLSGGAAAPLEFD
jgi:hypothetical protein